ncbi:SMI1/KNR4 family protein [Mesorhizobium sp. M0664]|uniref:SMI1/KNR4 family protein n=1 Tax=unclassified Mesorhizobium TaxID=325217 RepID=UPI0033383CE1
MGYSLTEEQFDAPAESAVVDGLAARLGVALPKDYTDFLKEHNGGEGFIRDNCVIFLKPKNWLTSIESMRLKNMRQASSCSHRTEEVKAMASTLKIRPCQSCASHS